MTRLNWKLYAGVAAQLIALAATVGLLSADEARGLISSLDGLTGTLLLLVPQLGTLAGLGHSIWVHHSGQTPPAPPGVGLPPGEMFYRPRSGNDHPRFGPD